MQANVSELLVEAATLLLAGMSVVFIFLTILIGAVKLIAAICARFPDAETESYAARPPVALSKPAGTSQATIAAIGAAIHQYRKSR